MSPNNVYFGCNFIISDASFVPHMLIISALHVNKCYSQLWSDFDRASSLICGNKMPNRYNRCFYCRSYCFLYMFRAPLCPSSGAREYYTVGCRLWSLVLGFHVVGKVWSWGLRVRLPGHTGGNQLYNTLELLMMGIIVPETCRASNKICNKKHLLHLVGILFPHVTVNSRPVRALAKLYVHCPLNLSIHS
jgi:hypothetical protein